MVTNRDIEIAFVQAQNRINEQIQNAQTQFLIPDIIEAVDVLAAMARKNSRPVVNVNNPIANEEI